MFTPLRIIVAIALVAGLVVGLTAAWTLTTADDRPVAESEEESPEPTVTLSGVPASLEGPVARIATGGDTPGPLAMVTGAHTVVVARSGADTVPAALLALRLRAPLALLPGPRTGSSDAQSAAAVSDTAAATAASEAPSASTAETAATPSAAASSAPGSSGTNSPAPTEPTRRSAEAVVAALTRLDVPRVVAIGDDDVVDAAREAGIEEVVNLRPSGTATTNARAIVRRAGGGVPPIGDVDPGLDRAQVQDLVANRPPAAESTETAVLVRPDDADALEVVLAARAVGHTVIVTRAQDIRADPRVVRRLSGLREDEQVPQVILGGAGMAGLDPAAVGRHAAIAATGVQLPGGGQVVFDPRRPSARRYVGLYGVTQSPALGALGEQPIDASVTRAERMASDYAEVVPNNVDIIPMFEIIATVASASAGRDGDYSNEQPISDLRPAVDAAREAGVYVLLDLQPGRTDFLTQAKRYRELLRQPHVGLALDPEWRLRPNERHLQQIGSVGIDEVNAVGDWLASLVRRQQLPQKMFLLHQFRTSMLRDREQLDTSHDELAFVVQMDGQGPQGTKLETWSAIKADAPPRLRFGWKNFYDEDTPTRSPADTMALEPPPVFVSYQ